MEDRATVAVVVLGLVAAIGILAVAGKGCDAREKECVRAAYEACLASNHQECISASRQLCRDGSSR